MSTKPLMVKIFHGLFLSFLTFSVTHGIYKRNAITNPDKLWPGGTVPYTFHSEIDAYRRVHMMAGMKQVMLSVYTDTGPCVLFVPRTNESDFVEISFVDEGEAPAAHVGRIGGPQSIIIPREVTQDGIVQELMFALGIYPEVKRADRDELLEIDYNNINKSYVESFDIANDTGTFSLPFDYETVAMYGPYFGAIDERIPTLTTKYEGFTIGQTVSLSNGDVSLVQHIYNCVIDSSHRIDILGPLIMECHFHFDLCEFTQEGDFEWELGSGPSSTLGTGPLADHSSGSGNYALAKAENHHSQIARLTTEPFPAGEYCFVTWLFMYGSDVGVLRVIQTNDNGDKTLFDIEQSSPRNMWYHASGTVSSESPVTIKIEAFMGQGDVGDIAIDDIYIYSGQCIDWY